MFSATPEQDPWAGGNPLLELPDPPQAKISITAGLWLALLDLHLAACIRLSRFYCTKAFCR